MQVEHFLEHSARRSPDKIALVFGERRATYRELDDEANRLAHALLASGLQRSDRVGIYLDNSVEAVVAIFAVLKAAGVFVLVNPQVKADKLAYILSDSGATAVVTDARKADSLRAHWSHLPLVRAVFTTDDAGTPVHGGKLCVPFSAALAARPENSGPPATKNIDVDLAALIYTSGSTGRPKGVMLTHLNIVSAANSITTYLENTSDDVILSFLPLAFDYGLYQALMAFKVGGRLILERSFGYPQAIVQTILREQVTGLPLVPTAATILLQLGLHKYDFSSLRYITNTAAALSPTKIQRLREAFPHAKIFSMYGLTECKRVSYLPPDQLDARPASVGRGMPNEEVYIVDAAGARVGAGVVGELVVRGANVMKGYWNQPEATAKALRPGPVPNENVLYTGDFFRMDEEGYLFFVGRRDDTIKTRGEKVSPREVEDVIAQWSGIADVAVFGVPDDVLGEAIAAVVTPAVGATLNVDEVRRHCARHLEDFMVPKFLDIRDTLPLTESGKINRRALQAAATGRELS